MAFSSMMTIAQEQRCLSNWSKRVKLSSSSNVTRQATRARYPNIPEDSPVFAALHRINTTNPDRLNDIPRLARNNFGDVRQVLDDEEGEYDHFMSATPTRSRTASIAAGLDESKMSPIGLISGCIQKVFFPLTNF